MRYQKPDREGGPDAFHALPHGRASDTNTPEELNYVEKTVGDHFDGNWVRRFGLGPEFEFLDDDRQRAIDAHAHGGGASAENSYQGRAKKLAGSVNRDETFRWPGVANGIGVGCFQ
jgi:hypothetical protein